MQRRHLQSSAAKGTLRHRGVLQLQAVVQEAQQRLAGDRRRLAALRSAAAARPLQIAGVPLRPCGPLLRPRRAPCELRKLRLVRKLQLRAGKKYIVISFIARDFA